MWYTVYMDYYVGKRKYDITSRCMSAYKIYDSKIYSLSLGSSSGWDGTSHRKECILWLNIHNNHDSIIVYGKITEQVRQMKDYDEKQMESLCNRIISMAIKKYPELLEMLLNQRYNDGLKEGKRQQKEIIRKAIGIGETFF